MEDRGDRFGLRQSGWKCVEAFAGSTGSEVVPEDLELLCVLGYLP